MRQRIGIRRRAPLWALGFALPLVAVLVWIWVSASPAKGPDVTLPSATIEPSEQALDPSLVGIGEDLPGDRSRAPGADPMPTPTGEASAVASAEDAVQNGSIRVLVRWEDSGELAEGVMVSLRHGRGSEALHRRLQAPTDKDGRVEFASVKPGEHKVAIHSSPMEDAVPVEVEAGGAHEVELVLPMGISISGVVQGAAGARVPYAELLWTDLYGEAEVIARTDETGAFVIRGIVSDGDLLARHPGEAPSIKRECEVSDGSLLDIVLRLRGPGASLEGFVVDEAGVPVADARVSLGTKHPYTEGPHGSEKRYLNRPAIRRALTDDQGHFEFVGVAPIEWMVLVDHLDLAPTQETVVLAPNAKASLNITLSAGGVAYGTITDTQGAPVEGVTVFTWSDPRSRLRYARRTTTDKEGAYELVGIPRLPDRPFRAVRVGTPEDATATLDFTAAPRVEWSPVVSRPSGLTGVVIGPAGEPLAKLTVVAISPAGWMDVAGTGADGSFSMGDGHEKGRDIYIMRPAQSGRPQHPNLPLHIEKDVLPATGPLVIQVTEEDLAVGSIEGQVIDSEGRIPSGALLSVEQWDIPVVTANSFEADGSFAIEEIPVGDFRLRFSAPDRADWMGRVRVEAGKTNDLGEIHSGKGGMIQWESASLQTSGWPEGLKVTASLAAGGEAGSFPLAKAGDQGPLAAGEYRFRFAAEGYALAEASAEIRNGETALVVVPATQVQEGPTFQIVGTGDTGIRARVTRAEGGTLLSMWFLGEGSPQSLVLPGLPDGAYALHLEGFALRPVNHSFEIRAGAAVPANATLTLK